VAAEVAGRIYHSLGFGRERTASVSKADGCRRVTFDFQRVVFGMLFTPNSLGDWAKGPLKT
jgi:hypothetical protein